MTINRLLDLAARRPKTVLPLLFAVSLVAALQLPALKVSVSAEGMVADDDPSGLVFERFKERFGGGANGLLYFQHPDLLAPDRLERLRRVIEAIEALPVVRETISLFSMNNVKTIDDTVVSRPFL